VKRTFQGWDAKCALFSGFDRKHGVC
jgi:hypothetical protein